MSVWLKIKKKYSRTHVITPLITIFTPFLLSISLSPFARHRHQRTISRRVAAGVKRGERSSHRDGGDLIRGQRTLQKEAVNMRPTATMTMASIGYPVHRLGRRYINPG